MSNEPLGKLAIIGAGPIGLEAALYARFLGFDVTVYEKGGVVANHVRQWGHVRFFTPFAMNSSPLGREALSVQTLSHDLPSDEAHLTGNEFVERYLEPLADSDLLSGRIKLNYEILQVGRSGSSKSLATSSTGRQELPFRLLLQDEQGNESTAQADVVIDASGVYSWPRWLGEGAVPAIGERSLKNRICYHIPHLEGEAGERYADKHTLVVGSGYSAATTIVGLEQLAAQHPRTKVTWLTRPPIADQTGPLAPIPGDRLPERAALTERANKIAMNREGPVRHIAGSAIERISLDSENRFVVEWTQTDTEPLVVDEIVAHVGYVPHRDLYRELQVHECYVSEGPMKLAAALMQNQSADCLDQDCPDAERLLNPEPNFFILGSKSYGRGSQFLISVGFKQIRQLFSHLTENPQLNLYGSFQTAT